jgi:hypothetical protein
VISAHITTVDRRRSIAHLHTERSDIERVFDQHEIDSIIGVGAVTDNDNLGRKV